MSGTLCDVKFSKIERNGRKFSHIELCISVISSGLNSLSLSMPAYDYFSRDKVPLSELCAIEV